ncbi:hypothetical protein MAR_019985, partial [Mya arenaria]
VKIGGCRHHNRTKGVIENFFMMATDAAYKEAKTLLEERFGNTFLIASAYRYGWQKKCLTVMKTIGHFRVVDDDQENRKLLTKLPDRLVTRWARIAAKNTEQHKFYPPFSEFADFVSQEAKLACDPVNRFT